VREGTNVGADGKWDSSINLLFEFANLHVEQSLLARGNGGCRGVLRKVVEDGEGWYRGNLLLAHQAHGFVAELCGVLDGSDAGLRCEERARLAMA